MKTLLTVLVVGLCLVGCGGDKASGPVMGQKSYVSDSKADSNSSEQVTQPKTEKPEPQHKVEEFAEAEKKEFAETKAKGEAGDSVAQYNLALMYDNAKGVPENDKEAAKWYRKAAEQGHVDAQILIGFMYNFGHLAPKETVTAYAWYSIAADNGGVNAEESKVTIAKEMTPKQIAKAEALAKEMIKKNPKLLQKKE